MDKILGIINLNEKEDRIRELTYYRPVASIPLMGRYRVIDFVLSNMVNSGISTVFVFTREKYRSLADHIRSGRPWDLERQNEGLFIFNPVQNFYTSMRSGDMDVIRDYIDYIFYDKSEYVVISPGYMVCNVDYRKVLEYHLQKGADITIIYKSVNRAKKRFEGCRCVINDEDGRVIDILCNRKSGKNIFMEMYLMKKSLFLDMLNKRVLGADHDLFMDTVMHLKSNLKIFTYEYQGYLSCINSVEAYYNHSMELLDEREMDSLFEPHWPIFTKVKNEPPAKYGEQARVSNSRIAGGTMVEGLVEDSILFRKVHVQRGAVVKQSILMQNSKVHENAVVENVIMDKNSVVTKGKTLRGTWENPLVLEKGKII